MDSQELFMDQFLDCISSTTGTGARAEHRASCHRCGNIRKNVIRCNHCPHVWCEKCGDKMKSEHGADIFTSGCPLFHCYKKCPSARKKGPESSPTKQRGGQKGRRKGCSSAAIPVEVEGVKQEQGQVQEEAEQEEQETEYDFMDVNLLDVADLICVSSQHSLMDLEALETHTQALGTLEMHAQEINGSHNGHNGSHNGITLCTPGAHMQTHAQGLGTCTHHTHYALPSLAADAQRHAQAQRQALVPIRRPTLEELVECGVVEGPVNGMGIGGVGGMAMNGRAGSSGMGGVARMATLACMAGNGMAGMSRDGTGMGGTGMGGMDGTGMSGVGMGMGMGGMGMGGMDDMSMADMGMGDMAAMEGGLGGMENGMGGMEGGSMDESGDALDALFYDDKETSATSPSSLTHTSDTSAHTHTAHTAYTDAHTSPNTSAHTYTHTPYAHTAPDTDSHISPDLFIPDLCCSGGPFFLQPTFPPLVRLPSMFDFIESMQLNPLKDMIPDGLNPLKDGYAQDLRDVRDVRERGYNGSVGCVGSMGREGSWARVGSGGSEGGDRVGKSVALQMADHSIKNVRATFNDNGQGQGRLGQELSEAMGLGEGLGLGLGQELGLGRLLLDPWEVEVAAEKALQLSLPLTPNVDSACEYIGNSVVVSNGNGNGKRCHFDLDGDGGGGGGEKARVVVSGHAEVLRSLLPRGFTTLGASAFAYDPTDASCAYPEYQGAYADSAPTVSMASDTTSNTNSDVTISDATSGIMADSDIQTPKTPKTPQIHMIFNGSGVHGGQGLGVQMQGLGVHEQRMQGMGIGMWGMEQGSQGMGMQGVLGGQGVQGHGQGGVMGVDTQRTVFTQTQPMTQTQPTLMSVSQEYKWTGSSLGSLGSLGVEVRGSHALPQCTPLLHSSQSHDAGADAMDGLFSALCSGTTPSVSRAHLQLGQGQAQRQGEGQGQEGQENGQEQGQEQSHSSHSSQCSSQQFLASALFSPSLAPAPTSPPESPDSSLPYSSPQSQESQPQSQHAQQSDMDLQYSQAQEAQEQLQLQQIPQQQHQQQAQQQAQQQMQRKEQAQERVLQAQQRVQEAQEQARATIFLNTRSRSQPK
ncbi:hypothetical protein B484DRAFT_417269 [Ochromonadaceae sp. CCMP2298]|nr:hypothetical protein B484DRAFT_417269 [Ochromonadaceae sp. CCMP2298]